MFSNVHVKHEGTRKGDKLKRAQAGRAAARTEQYEAVECRRPHIAPAAPSYPCLAQLGPEHDVCER